MNDKCRVIKKEETMNSKIITVRRVTIMEEHPNEFSFSVSDEDFDKFNIGNKITLTTNLVIDGSDKIEV